MVDTHTHVADLMTDTGRHEDLAGISGEFRQFLTVSDDAIQRRAICQRMDSHE